MGVLIPEGFALCNIIVTLSGRPSPYVVTMGVDPPPIMSPGVIAEAVHSAVTADGSLFPTTPGGAWCNQYRYDGVRVTLMTSSGPLIGEALHPQQGTVTSEVTPPQVAVLVRKSTATGGRAGRGRSFWPNAWWAENGIDAQGVITPSVVLNMQGKINIFRSELTSNDVPAVLLHSSPSLAPSPILDMTVETLVATQRRRLRR